MLSGKNENGINYYTARKLKDMAQSLEQLAKAFDEGAGETMSLTKDDGLAAMQTCAALVCGNCGGCSLYAEATGFCDRQLRGDRRQTLGSSFIIRHRVL